MSQNYNKIVISAGNLTTDLVMTGAVEGGDPAETTLPQLTATAYQWTPAGNGSPVDPQPTFKWVSSNPDVAAVDQSGNVTRTTANPNASSFDSNGAPSVGQIGGLATIRAIALRGDGSESVEGQIVISVQAQGFQIPTTPGPLSIPLPAMNTKGPVIYNNVGWPNPQSH